MFAPVDIASLTVLRMAIGVLMFVASMRYWAHGWIDELLVSPATHIPYWVVGVGSLDIEPMSGLAMRGLFLGMAACGLLVAVGWLYRPAIVILLISFLYVESIDATNYLNHYYAITLVLAFMAVTPLHGAWSVDAALHPRMRRATVAAWMPWAVRVQLAIIYGFAGTAKLHADWLSGTVLHMWLRSRGEGPWIAQLLADPDLAQCMAVAGAAFDLLVVPALLWRRTRIFAWIAVVGFHLATGALFPIGMFPWIMIALSTVFFAPDWPRRWLGGHVEPNTLGTGPHPRPLWIAVAVLLYFTLQILLPLRFLAYPGDVRWHEQGMRWSWRVMLVEKTGLVELVATDPLTNRSWRIDPLQDLTPRQSKMVATQPDLILAYAHQVYERFADRGFIVEVRAESFVALNGRPSQRFIDPTVDLAAVVDGLAPYTFVLPFVESPQP